MEFGQEYPYAANEFLASAKKRTKWAAWVDLGAR